MLRTGGRDRRRRSHQPAAAGPEEIDVGRSRARRRSRWRTSRSPARPIRRSSRRRTRASAGRSKCRAAARSRSSTACGKTRGRRRATACSSAIGVSDGRTYEEYLKEVVEPEGPRARPSLAVGDHRSVGLRGAAGRTQPQHRPGPAKRRRRLAETTSRCGASPASSVTDGTRSAETHPHGGSRHRAGGGTHAGADARPAGAVPPDPRRDPRRRHARVRQPALHHGARGRGRSSASWRPAAASRTRSACRRAPTRCCSR